MALKDIIVIGATGLQGGALINALLENNPQIFSIFAVTRNASSPSAIQLSFRGVKVIQGDIADPSAIFSEILNPYGVFLVTLPTANEERQALSMIDAAISNGIQHFIFTSVDRGGPIKSDMEPTAIPHFATKLKIENYLKKTTAENGGHMKWTILRPTSFMDNLSPGFIGKIAATSLKQMGTTRVSLISTADIGKAAAQVFMTPDHYGGKALTLTGDLLTFEFLYKIFQEEKGKDIPLTFEFVSTCLECAISDFGATMKFFRDGGYDYEMDNELARELGLRDFRTWLREDSKF